MSSRLQVVTCTTSLTCKQNYSVKVKVWHSLTVHYEEHVQSIWSEFERRFADCIHGACRQLYVLSIWCKYWCWWHCHQSQISFCLGKLRSWGWDSDKTLQNDIEIKARSTWWACIVLETIDGGEVSQSQKMCLEPDGSFWINLFERVCFLAHENHQVQVQINNDWRPPCSLPKPCNQLLHSWLREASLHLPVPCLPLR